MPFAPAEKVQSPDFFSVDTSRPYSCFDMFYTYFKLLKVTAVTAGEITQHWKSRLRSFYYKDIYIRSLAQKYPKIIF